MRDALARGPQTPFELVRPLLELSPDQELTPMMVSLGLNMVLAYLCRVEVLGEAGRIDGGAEPERWELRYGRRERLEVRPRPGRVPGPRAAPPAVPPGSPASPATC